MEIESDTDSDDCNGGHAAKHDTLAEVMRLEFDNADRLLSNEAQMSVEKSMFSVFEMHAVSVLARAKAQVGYKQHSLKDILAKSTTKDQSTMHAELIKLQNAVLKQTRVVEKAKQVKNRLVTILI